MQKAVQKFFWLALLLVAGTIFVGCASDDEIQNASSRPWNTPKGWETGFPTGLTEGR